MLYRKIPTGQDPSDSQICRMCKGCVGIPRNLGNLVNIKLHTDLLDVGQRVIMFTLMAHDLKFKKLESEQQK